MPSASSVFHRLNAATSPLLPCSALLLLHPSASHLLLLSLHIFTQKSTKTHLVFVCYKVFCCLLSPGNDSNKAEPRVLQVQRPTPPQFVFLVNPLKETNRPHRREINIHRLKREESTRRSFSFPSSSSTQTPLSFNCWRNINGGDWVLRLHVGWGGDEDG
ncbi:hypothetical protein HPP92_007521 [Vanilla planifolia]|uniref:Uncharacterized protein n=1 Tax=Vanilla planifolia TaxID=51239 RepID=A0A835V9I1_VANPL|nr:hypothetical protein HPP92_007521 [Vanilla planifolia]